MSYACIIMVKQKAKGNTVPMALKMTTGNLPSFTLPLAPGDAYILYLQLYG